MNGDKRLRQAFPRSAGVSKDSGKSAENQRLGQFARVDLRNRSRDGWLHFLTTDRASSRLSMTETSKVSVRNAKTRHQLLPEAYLAACSDNAGNPDRSTSAKSLTLAAMSLGYGVVQLDVTIENTALNGIGTSLGGGVTELQWVVSAYTIAFAALILTAGALGDRIGAKKVFMMGFALFTTASLACALAPTAVTLIAARAVQGAGAAILVPNSLALRNHVYSDERKRGWAVGIWAAGASVALTAGPLAGGSLIALVGWRSIFLVNLPIGVAGSSPLRPRLSCQYTGQSNVIKH